MKVSTNISNVIDGNADKSKYDAEVKRILSDKTILAWILRFAVKEFAGYSVEDIRECIEGEPEVAKQKVLPGYTPEAITGMNTEDALPGEGTITYDLRFCAVIPGGERVKLIINVEAQKYFYPGYDIVTRAIFYCARLLSAQCSTEFIPGNYDDIKKVYSIWICMDVPRRLEHTITRYRMTKEDVCGTVSDNTRHDLLEAVMVCLGREEEAGSGTALHGLLSTLLSERLQPSEKKEILEQEYGIATSVELEGGLQRMCNLSDLIEEKGMKKGMEKGMEKGILFTLISLVNDGILTEEDAAGRMGLSAVSFRALWEEYSGKE